MDYLKLAVKDILEKFISDFKVKFFLFLTIKDILN